MRYILLNSTLTYNHIGCYYTSIGLRNFLNEAGWLCAFECDVNNYNISFIRDVIANNEDVFVVVNGEGTFHDNQEYALFIARLLEGFENRTIIMNSQMRQMESIIPFLKKVRLIQVRTRRDEEWCLCEAFLDNVRYCPDMIFFSGLDRLSVKKNNLTVYTDSHDALSSRRLYASYVENKMMKDNSEWVNFHYSLAGNERSKLQYYIRSLANKLGIYENFRFENWVSMRSLPETLWTIINSDCIVTGRYHAACIAMIFNIPLVYAESNTSKVSDLCDDFKYGVHISNSKCFEFSRECCSGNIIERAAVFKDGLISAIYNVN